MRGRRHQMRRVITAEVRLDTAKSARFSGSVPSTHLNSPLCPLYAGGGHDLPLPELIRNAILGRENAGIWRMSGVMSRKIDRSQDAGAAGCAVCLQIGRQDDDKQTALGPMW